MTEIEKSLRKALEDKVSGLKKDSSPASKPTTKDDEVTKAMDKLTADKKSKKGDSGLSKSNSDQDQGAKCGTEKSKKISAVQKLFAAAKGGSSSAVDLETSASSSASDIER